MSVYWCILLWVTIWSLGYLLLHVKNKYLDIIFLCSTFLPVSLLVGMRDNQFADTDMYERIFRDIPNDSYVDIVTRHYHMYYEMVETGYLLLNKTISLCTESPTVFFLFCSFFTFLGIALFYYKISPNLPTSVFLFFAFGYYIAAFNIVRQYLALPFFLMGIYFLIRDKKYKFLAMIGIGSLFHYSILIFLPLVFFNQIKKHLMLATTMLCVVDIVGIMVFPRLLMLSPKYSQYLNSAHMQPTQWGFGVLLMFAIYIIPSIFVWIGYRNGYYEKSEENIIAMCLLFSTASILICLTQYTAFAIVSRFSFYTDIFTTLTWIYFLKLFTARTRVIIYSMLLILGWGYYNWYLKALMGTAIVPL